jgi:hypothetical protein
MMYNAALKAMEVYERVAVERTSAADRIELCDLAARITNALAELRLDTAFYTNAPDQSGKIRRCWRSHVASGPSISQLVARPLFFYYK